jgi:hypothetical protein
VLSQISSVYRGVPVNSKSKAYFFGPILDWSMTGGLSLIVALYLWCFVPTDTPLLSYMAVASFLVFFADYPHFIASYWLFYIRRKQEITSSLRNLCLAYLLPALLIVYFGFAYHNSSQLMVQLSIQFMFFAVGHHYVKQFFGAILIASKRCGFVWSHKEVKLFKLSLYPLWWVNFIGYNKEPIGQWVGGFQFENLHFSYVVEWSGNILSAISALLITIMMLRRWQINREWIGPVALSLLLALYIWMIPALSHPAFFMLMPAFHSIQYLFHVFALQRDSGVKAQSASETEIDKTMFFFPRLLIVKYVLFCSAGWLLFSAIAGGANSLLQYEQGLFGANFVLLALNISVNLHHYSLDFVLWRMSHTENQVLLPG